MSEPIDAIDRKILRALLSKGRSTFAELAAQVGLTAPTVHDRVKKLERSGVIEGYSASIDASVLGLDLTALVSITTSATVASREYEQRLAQMPEIQECFSVAGEETYVARVITRDSRSLEQLLQRIKALPGTLRTKAKVILSSPIRRSSLPFDERDDVPAFASESQHVFARSSTGH